MFRELNKKGTIRDGIVLENMEFKPLQDFCGRTLKVDGFFFTNGKFGRQTVVVANGYKVNMPLWATDTFQTICDTPDYLKAVLDGKLSLINIKKTKTKNGETTSFDLEDC